MNFQNDKYTLRFAVDSDNDGIREIFESGCFDGRLSVQFLRGQRPLESFRLDGDDARILVITDNEKNRLAAVGGAVLRREYVGGTPEMCAYLTGLKIHPDYRHKIIFIAKAYQFFYQQVPDCRLYYTTILDENRAAISLLEKGHRNMPHYHYLGHYTTYCFHGGKRRIAVEKGNTDGFDGLLRSYFSTRDLTPADPGCAGFGENTFYCVRENGKIRACCFVGNQQGHKQYKMSSYGGILKFVSHLPTDWFGYPKFPGSGEMINFGVVSYLYVENEDEKLCSDFLRSVAAEAGFSLLIWGAFDGHPLCPALDGMKTVRYGSRLYSVEWEGERGAGEELAGVFTEVFGVEAALL